MPPVYPRIAQSGRIQGVVLVDVTIDVNGKIVSAQIVRSANRLFNDAALAR